MHLSLKIKIGLTILIFGFLFSFQAQAATLDLALEKNIASVKDDVNVLVSINSETQDINTAQATISFPTDLLEVTAIDRTDSIFSFWLKEPSFDNAKGTISFVGGSISGVNGPGLKIMHIAFKVKGSGTGRLGITDAAITASDGTGANVYNTAKGLDINIPTTAQFQAVQLVQSQKQATIVKQSPAIPILDVPFYPDPTKWNNRSASFQATWKMGSDISKAGISLDKNSNSIPTESAEALSGSKIFPALTDGISYLHLRFANNVGWGPTLHYRLAIDTAPPLSFNVTSPDSFKTNNPKPTINFKSSDLTSGVNNYIIRLDGVNIATVNTTTYQFAPLLPGVHKLTVVAVDNAGNSTSQTETLEILPIASPTITYVSRRVYTNEGQITAGGTATDAVEVNVQVQNSQKQIVFEQVVPVDTNGNWNITINKDISSGNYNLLVTSRDKNMASSFPVVSDTIKIAPKPLLVLGNIEITQAWFFIILILILMGSFGAGWFSFNKWRGRLDGKIIIAERDVANVIDNSKKDIDKHLKNYSNGNLSPSDLTEMEFILKKMKDNLEKSHRYVVDNIREINK